MSEKTRRLERDIQVLTEERKTFVTHDHLDAVVEPMRRSLEILAKDVKEILRVVSSSHRPKG